MTRFSLIIPAHNEEDWLRRCLTSVCAQRDVDMEILVICDRCTDGSAEVCRSFGVEPVLVDAGGAGPARNVGIDRASGRYLLFLDADDRYIDDRSVWRIDQALHRYGDPDVLHFSFLWGRELVPPVNWHGRLYGMAWCRAWRRDAVGDIRFPHRAYAEDYTFCLEVYRQGVSHAVLEDPLVVYTYPRPDSLSVRWNGLSVAQRAGIREAERSASR